MSTRALAPVVAVVLVIGVTVTLAAAVALALGMTDLSTGSPRIAIGGTVDVETHTLRLEHLGGDAVSVKNIELLVHVDDEPLRHQPPIPFFAATGFVSGPTGPFNSATDDIWEPGERGTIRLASTNEPLPGPHATVTVTVRHGETVIATAPLDHA